MFMFLFRCTAAALLVSCLYLSAAAQLRPYRVTSSDGTPVAYAKLVNPAGTYGMIADSLGYFKLPASLPSADTLEVGAIGYRTLLVTIGQLRTAGGAVLLEAPIEFAPSLVQVDRGKAQRLGRDKTSGVATFRYVVKETPGSAASALLEDGPEDPPLPATDALDTAGYKGSEFGIRLKLDRPTWLKSIHVHFKSNTFDTLRFRLHLYRFVGGVPKEELLPREFRFDVIGRSIGWQVFDISTSGFEASGDCLFALEILEHSTSLPDALLEMEGTLSVGSSAWIKRRVGAGWRRVKAVPTLFIEAFG